MNARRSSHKTLILIGCAALLSAGLWHRQAAAQTDVYKPIREMWTAPLKAWQAVTTKHVAQFLNPMTGTPTAKLFSPLAHASAWATTAKNSGDASKQSWAAWHRGMGTLHEWRGSYHQGRALGTGMVGLVGLSTAHTVTARQHQAASQLHAGLAKFLNPQGPSSGGTP